MNRRTEPVGAGSAWPALILRFCHLAILRVRLWSVHDPNPNSRQAQRTAS
jgi:hypothetical protein